MKKIFLLAFSFLYIFHLQAQSTFVPFNTDYYHLVDRYEIKKGSFAEHLFTAMKPYSRKGVAALADSMILKQGLSQVDRFNLIYLLNDNSEWADSLDNKSKKAIWNRFYKTKADLFRLKDNDLDTSKDFDFHLNPVLHLSVGNDGNSQKRPFTNTRGAEIRGMIARRLGFYSYIAENQAIFPFYAQQFITDFQAVPYEGFWKTYKDPTGTSITNGVDFLTARGYISFDIIKKYVSLQFGYDKNAYGVGYRSLQLSDFANNYTFLKLNTKIWKFNYSNLYTQMFSESSGTNRLYPKKYVMFHHLSLNLTDNLNFGFFESIAYGRDDLYRDDTFELAYLNPIIFYRSLEQNMGSQDNSIAGIDFKWNFLKQFQLYGQLVIDELVISEVRAGNGWWANKQAWQLGFKYIDVLNIPNLDLQVELNTVRPFTYTHFDKPRLSNYTHFSQPLAHPLGANFREILAILRYQPIPKLSLTAKVFSTKMGRDWDGKNWGSDILLDNTTKELEYGNRVGQGVATNLTFIDLTASYQLKHNLFIDLKQVIRNQQTDFASRNYNTNYTALSLRLNIQQRLHEF
ncbi:hypothetical protein [Thermoflexibacter ruber]|uniref:Capsule assembly protein Wzi n=1 Tax=Thermoflexibacter ruber TaxID=1003 RepID=A0A1I2EL71_9BACT|nr:hypothetical protein [Thermoflexibacter ruber]SFE93615.1 hypothetical protein SAMN04488541_101079 [Thermoflexibacter ruber]